jgi:hypothetical protein
VIAFNSSQQLCARAVQKQENAIIVATNSPRHFCIDAADVKVVSIVRSNVISKVGNVTSTSVGSTKRPNDFV